MTKINKTLLATMIIALFAMNSVQSIYFITRLNYCYHQLLCMRYASFEYRRLYYAFGTNPIMRIYLALAISRVLRTRSRMFGWHYHNSNSAFAPVLAFKTMEPYDGFNRHYGHIYRQLEESDRMLETDEAVEDDPFKIEEMNKCDSVASCKKTMCESAEHDHKNLNNHYGVIKTYYKMVMQAKYFEFRGVKQNIEFFESSCFDKNYQKEKEVVYDTRGLTEGAILDLHTQDQEDHQTLLEIYPIFNIPRPDNFDEAEEKALGSSTIDDEGDSGSVPVPENTLNGDSDKVYMEPIFNKQGDIVKMVETVF